MEAIKLYLRASTINLSELAVRIKIIYYYLVGDERGGERMSGLLCKSQF
jgi:hypothetical protein